MSEKVYSYRAGQKIELEKKPDQFVVRALPEELGELGIPDAQQVSSASSRVTTRTADLEPLMSTSRHVAPTHHAYHVADTGDEFLITDRIFVTFRHRIPDEDVDAFAGRYSLVRLQSYGDRDYLFQLTDHTGMNPVKLVVKLTEEEPLVEAAEHDLNQRMSISQVALPTDPAYGRQWHLHTQLIDPDFDPRSSSRCEAAWQLLGHFGSADVVVGVTDDGCKLDHVDFDSPDKFAGWGYFRDTRLITDADVDADPDEMYIPGSNHGTSCAGVIGGEVDAVLTVGAAPGCRLLPIQWESDGPSLFISDSKLLTALNHLADKVDVLSNSWSGVPLDVWATPVVNRVRQLAETGGRRGRGILFLWAAGNDNCPINHNATVDVPYTHGWEIKPDGSAVWIGPATARRFWNNLAGIPGLMHVAALASTARRSHYSNYGTGVLICAPTSNGHAYYRLSVGGLDITTTTGSGAGTTHGFGGTSSATPLVAGIAALVISANPDLPAEEVASILKQTASKDLDLEGYPRTPPAAYDPDTSWDVSPIAPFDQGDFTDIGDPDGTWSPWIGHGRVDAANAVAEALRRWQELAQQTFQGSSSPELEIPDRFPEGIRDTIPFAEAAILSAIQVSVDLRHTFIGDLRLTLISPSGTAVVLHDRAGGSANNIRRAYDLTTTPALSSFVGESIQGDWVLHVQDLATRDVGRLKDWEIEIQGLLDAVIDLEEAPGATIPDRDPKGITRKLQTDEPGQVQEVEASVDITHTYVGDLVLTLTSPAGTDVNLHWRLGGSRDSLIETYTKAVAPGLLTLRGEPIAGTWRLNVADLAAYDKGKLNRWALRIVRQP